MCVWDGGGVHPLLQCHGGNVVKDGDSLCSIQYKYLDFEGTLAAPFQDERGGIVKKEKGGQITPSRCNKPDLDVTFLFLYKFYIISGSELFIIQI